MEHNQTNTHTEVVFRSEAAPGVRYGSSLSFYDEQLVRGRYVGRYRSSIGRVKYTQGIDTLLDEMVGRRPVEAFQLNVDGFDLTSHWRWIDGREEPDDTTKPGTRHTVVELAHELRPIRVKVHTRLDGTPFMARWLEITNTGTEPAALTHVAPWAGLLWHVDEQRGHLAPDIASAFTVGHSELMQFGREGDWVWKPLHIGTQGISADNGRSGWGLPFFIARNEVTGESVMAHLAWSGNWKMEFRVDEGSNAHGEFFRDGPPPDADLFFSMAPTAPAPQRIIAPGETITSPAVHLGFLRGNLDNTIHALHTHLRRSVFTPQVPERGLLVGAGRVVEHDESWLKHEVDLTVETGCEYFMVDAGWYGTKPNSWHSTVGDWNVGDWLPEGLQGLRDYIHARGLLFGLWMEPESIGIDSKLVLEHPDWVLQRDGAPVERALDLSKPEVARYVEDEIMRVIREHQPELFKLDYNSIIYAGGQHIDDGRWEDTQWRHYEALYAIFDRVREQFPDVVLENCGAGGGRNDLGMASRFHISCQSDWTLPPRSVKALNNMTMGLPPEQIKYYFGHIQGYHEYGDLDFQLRVPLFANPIFVGFGPPLEGMDPHHLARVRHYIELYKTFMRPLLPVCEVYHHTDALPLAATPPWCVLEYAAPDRSRAYAGIFRLGGAVDPIYQFYARGLDPARTYTVTFENSGTTAEMSGARLMQDGLRIRLERPLTSELLLFESR